MLIIIIAQINLLLSLVNDVLDHRLILENRFAPKEEHFSPKEAFNFIMSVFGPQIYDKQIIFDFRSVANFEAINKNMQDEKEMELPEFLIGDKIRMTQVVINLIKTTLKF